MYYPHFVDEVTDSEKSRTSPVPRSSRETTEFKTRTLWSKVHTVSTLFCSPVAALVALVGGEGTCRMPNLLEIQVLISAQWKSSLPFFLPGSLRESSKESGGRSPIQCSSLPSTIPPPTLCCRKRDWRLRPSARCALSKHRTQRAGDVDTSSP